MPAHGPFRNDASRLGWKREDSRRDLREGLILRHDVEIVVGNDLKKLEQIVEHATVLRGHADAMDDIGVRLQRVDDRGHFDRVRARAENGHYAQFV